jgi:hypothetical protein
MTHIQNTITAERKLITTLAICTALKNEIEDKGIFSLYVFESEIGKFPDDMKKFSERLMRLHGYDSNVLVQKKGFRILSEIHDIENDRVFIIVIVL